MIFAALDVAKTLNIQGYNYSRGMEVMKQNPYYNNVTLLQDILMFRFLAQKGKSTLSINLCRITNMYETGKANDLNEPPFCY